VNAHVAGQCFWLGRYLDRVESSARLLTAARALALDAGSPVSHCWRPLLLVSGEERRFEQEHGQGALDDGEIVQAHLTWSRQSAISLVSSVRFAREAALAVHEQLSRDAFEEVSELHAWLGGADARALYHDDRDTFYRRARRSTQLALGLSDGTMLREKPILFLRLGALLERAGQTARSIDMHHHTLQREDADEIVRVALWMSLLRACSGADAFMSKQDRRLTAQTVVAFLLLEPAFPRSLYHCLATAHALLRQIGGERNDDEGAHGSLVRIEALLAWLQGRSKDIDVARIDELLGYVASEVAAIGAHVADEMLSSPGPRDPIPPATL
jgi:uncharacterized alpha-E superfamily protein